MKYPLLLLVSLFLSFKGLSQNHEIDSLRKELTSISNDTIKVKTLMQLAEVYKDMELLDSVNYYSDLSFALSQKAGYYAGMTHACYLRAMTALLTGNLERAKIYSTQAVQFARLSPKRKELADCYNMLALTYSDLGDYKNALIFFEKAITIHTEIKNDKGIGSVYNNMGTLYDVQGNYVEAIKCHLASLKYCEQTGNKKGMARSYNNLGVVSFAQMNFAAALDYYEKGLKINNVVNNKQMFCNIYNNMANVFTEQKQFAKALKYYFLSLDIEKETGNRRGESVCYTGIGNIYLSTGNYEEALKNHLTSLKIKEEINDQPGLPNVYVNMASDYRGLKRYKEAIKYCKKSIALATEMGLREPRSDANHILSVVYENTGDFKNALIAYKEYVSGRDSLLNEENTKKTVRLEMNYEFDKKEAAARLEQEKKQVLAKAESNRQKIIIWSIAGVLVMAVAFGLYAYRSYLQKRKANEAITRQKEVIEEKQKEILDSIHYARRIQRSLLTSEKYISRNIQKLKEN